MTPSQRASAGLPLLTRLVPCHPRTHPPYPQQMPVVAAHPGHLTHQSVEVVVDGEVVPGAAVVAPMRGPVPEPNRRPDHPPVPVR